MPDGDDSGEVRDLVLVEGLAHQAHGGADADAPAVPRGDAHALLAPVLERVKTEEGDAGHVVAARVHADDAALFAGVIAFRDFH